jgi:hypothetical protein
VQPFNDLKKKIQDDKNGKVIGVSFLELYKGKKFPTL